MKHSFRVLLATGLLVATTAAVSPTAAAVQASVGGVTCNAYAYSLSDGASAARGTCDSVRSSTSYRDSGGTLRSVTGSWGATSQAKGTTSMVVSRGVNISFLGSTTGWIGY